MHLKPAIVVKKTFIHQSRPELTKKETKTPGVSLLWFHVMKILSICLKQSYVTWLWPTYLVKVTI